MVEGVGINEAKWLLEDVIAKGSTNSTPLSKEPARISSQQKQAEPGELVLQKEPGSAEELPEMEGLTLTPSRKQQ